MGWFWIEKFFGYWKLKLRGSVAQSVEQRPFKALVPGSSPGRPNTQFVFLASRFIVKNSRFA